MEARFLDLAGRYLEQYLSKIQTCVELLTEDELWWRPNDRSNSVGNLLLHLRGNLTQWVLSGVAGEAFERDRTAEFRAHRNAAKGELLRGLGEAVGRCREAIRALSKEELAGARRIQGVETDGLGAILHAVEHMSYHTGQIVFTAKQLIGDRAELEFYPELRGR